MLNRRSFSDVLPESPKSARKKEEARQAEFVRIGQVNTPTNTKTPLTRRTARNAYMHTHASNTLKRHRDKGVNTNILDPLGNLSHRHEQIFFYISGSITGYQ